MLSQRDVTKINDTLRTSLDKIGKEPPAECKRNTERVAWEFYVAAQLQNAAEGRRKKAIELAIESGVIFDHKKDPRSPGDYSVFSGDIIDIILKVKNPSVTIDTKALISDVLHVISSGKPLTVPSFDKLIAKHTKTGAAAHQFTAALKAGNATTA